mmetsp:Transcript_377/g.437  ORF Transcript_377/g.437 Transcript_377/m.437 type:complete len:249 (+) Transcript_377:1189-1935(+)
MQLQEVLFMLSTLQLFFQLGVEAIPGFTFLFVSEPKPFLEAENDCRSRGGHLASIGSAQENLEAFQAGDQRSTFFIGFNDRVTEGTFVWTDGSPSTFSNFNTDQPNGDGDCVMYFGSLGVGIDFKWFDTSCDSTLPYLCKLISASPISATPTASPIAPLISQSSPTSPPLVNQADEIPTTTVFAVCLGAVTLILGFGLVLCKGDQNSTKFYQPSSVKPSLATNYVSQFTSKPSSSVSNNATPNPMFNL